MRIEGVYIELVASEPGRLAAFYERLAGLERVLESPQGVTLSGAGLTVAIRKGVDPAPEDRGDGPVVGFVTASANPDAIGGELSAAGAIVLSEAKRDGRRTFHCSDPSGYEFAVLVVAEDAAPPEGPGALVPVTTANGGELIPRATPARQSPPIGPTMRRVTRRDVDMLRDSARLAEMKESIAGLSTAFGAEDPASVLDDMRGKIGPGASESELAASDAVLRAGHRATEAESLLDRYKRELLGIARDEERAEPATSRQAVTPRPSEPPPAEEDAVDMARLRRSLGGSADTDE